MSDRSRSALRSTKAIPTALAIEDVLLVPRRSPVRSRRDVDLSSTVIGDLRLSIPILSSNVPWCTETAMAVAMARLGGMGCVHRMQTIDDQADQVRQVKRASTDGSGSLGVPPSVDGDGRLLVAAAVGVADDFVKRAEALVDAETDVLLVDAAHGHLELSLNAVHLLRERYPDLPIMAGNVATAEGVEDLVAAGAGAVKVGIGPGGVCTTRAVAGVGVPQFTAVLECAAAGRELGVPIVADGGIRKAGDITKVLAAGAASVMLGSALAGTEESAAVPGEDDGHSVRSSTGYVSLGMRLTLRRAEGLAVSREDFDDYVPEGVEVAFPATGPLRNVLRQLTGGVQSGLSYCGAPDVPTLQAVARFVRVTPGGMQESRPHAGEGDGRLIGRFGAS
ncbi:IMP dehydrogenase/GMP reductase [Nonomuraea solani]|uniref:IMP dehydrogenase/GMP reductase n=1 Tax=Nonomuraea solani TaxID=1144553 RepID=A0A1H6F2B0_9ACTN|nr:IMP dehydrogenase [Nonomuraea solani]SEH03084.1 IMP dehydrogenase/GMP reductase [Nonomuraea solani]